MRTEIIKITEEDSLKVQRAEIKSQSMQQIFVNFLEEHLLNEDTSFLRSPVYLKYQEMLEDAELELSKIKDSLISKYIDEEKQKRILRWNLSYATFELSYVLSEE